MSYAEKAGRMPCVIEWSNDADTCIGGASRSDAKKAGSVQSIESRQCYDIEVEKQKFICESFQLDSSAILKEDTKLKEEVIKLFQDNFEVLATHPSQYGETNVSPSVSPNPASVNMSTTTGIADPNISRSYLNTR